MNNKILEIYYMLRNWPFFYVKVLSNGRKVKTFIQLAASKEKGETFFLVCRDLKKAWWKPVKPIVDGLRFEVYADLKNAIPLKIVTETKYYESELVIKEVKEVTISEDEERQKENKKTGLPETLAEISYPPDVLFQQVEAHFVKEILAVPTSKWENLKEVFIIAIIAGAILVWYLTSKGIIKF